MPPDPYRILRVRRDASQVEISQAFATLAKSFHPDTASHARIEEFRVLKEAYDLIRSSELRREFDDARRLRRSGDDSESYRERTVAFNQRFKAAGIYEYDQLLCSCIGRGLYTYSLYTGHEQAFARA